jgi:hypothetical protein
LDESHLFYLPLDIINNKKRSAVDTIIHFIADQFTMRQEIEIIFKKNF